MVLERLSGAALKSPSDAGCLVPLVLPCVARLFRVLCHSRDRQPFGGAATFQFSDCSAAGERVRGRLDPPELGGGRTLAMGAQGAATAADP